MQLIRIKYRTSGVLPAHHSLDYAPSTWFDFAHHKLLGTGQDGAACPPDVPSNSWRAGRKAAGAAKASVADATAAKRWSASRKNPETGNTVLFAAIFITVVLVLMIVNFEQSSSKMAITSSRINDQDAIRIAEAGIEKVVWCLNNPSASTTTCPGNPSNYTGESNVNLGRGTFTTNWDSVSKTVTATGTVTGTRGTSAKTIKASLYTSGTQASFNYGLQVGTGGIDMSNTSQIIGNVFVNGSVTARNTPTITGNVILAVGDATTNVQVDPSPNVTTAFGQSSPNTRSVAQSFVPTLSDSVYEIDLKISRTSSAPTNLTLRLYTDDPANNRPNNQLASKTVAASTFPINNPGWENGWTEVSFGPTALTSGTTYWIVLDVGTQSNTNYYFVLHSTADPYAGNTAKIGPNLTTGLTQLGNPGADIAFAVKLGGTFPEINMGGNTVGGSVKAHSITDTEIGNHAHYQVINGTVHANTASTAEVCTTSSTSDHCHPNAPEETPAPLPLTSAQINELENGAGSTTIGSQSFTDGTTSLGPVVINGDLSITNTAEVILTGTVWVKGNIELKNSAKIMLSESYGSDSGVIIAHDPANPTTKGKFAVSNSAQIIGNSNPDTFVLAIAMSNDLVISAIELNNSQAGSIFYAPNGLVDIGNAAALKELVAKKISIRNSATITYDQGLANEFFTSGPGGSWGYKKGTYLIVN